MAKNDTTVLVHPGGTKVEVDAANKSRVEELLRRGYTQQKQTSTK